MTSDWLPVTQALDTLEAPLALFLRDDDAGWDDARLFALLDTTARASVPIDLAAIPLAVTAALAAALNARIDAAPGLIGVHQHGCAHTNHEGEGRKCEFGPARDATAQRHDLQRGRALLRHHFGARLQPFFTPPWNRCAPHTPTLLAELGYTLLSRERGALTQQAQAALPELAVDVDWSKHHRAGGVPAVAAALVQAIQARRQHGQPLGLMLHHAVMSPAEFDDLAAALAAWAHHPNARRQSMSACIAVRTSPALT